ncbi:UDP-N-acetylmuramate dehydrogenase [soil metagenome]
MVMAALGVEILRDVALETWFGCGGGARRLARPTSVAEVRACVAIDRELKVFGDGANVLVADGGVEELVVELSAPAFTKIELDAERGVVTAGGGADFAKVILESVRAGLAGLEGLGGIPATVGGAAAMNAGGAFGEVGTRIARVRGVGRDGREVDLGRADMQFEYRRSSLATAGVVITEVEFALARAEGGAEGVRARLLEVMAYKKRTQPMGAHSAGCCFKNPTLTRDVAALGEKAVAGARVSAGMLIDRAGCKGLRVGGAEISSQHANFFVAHAGCKAADVIELTKRARGAVLEKFGVEIEAEVKVWGFT